MRSKTLILMVVAIGCGLAAAYLSVLYGRQGQAPAPPPDDKVAVLVALRDLPAFTAIRDPKLLFREERRSRSELPKAPVGELKKAESRTLKVALKKDDPLVEGDLLQADQIGIESKLKPGERAFTVKVNAQTGVGGFIMPGSRVDVIGSQNRSGSDGAFSQAILQDIEVLAIEAQLEKRDESERHKQVDHVTLRVTLPQAEILSAYTDTGNTGNIRLVSRRPDDVQQVSTAGFSAQGGRSKSKLPVSEPAEPASTSSVVPAPSLLAPTVPDVEPAKVANAGPKEHIITVIGNDKVQEFRYPIKDRKETEEKRK